MVQSNTIVVTVSSPAKPVITGDYVVDQHTLQVSGTGFTPSSTATLLFSPALSGVPNPLTLNTDSNGNINFADLTTVSATYTVVATDITSRYQSPAINIVVAVDNSAFISITASNVNTVTGVPITITGTVLDAANNPMVSRAVTLTDITTGATNTTTTNSLGQYSFSVTFATVGSYTLDTSS